MPNTYICIEELEDGYFVTHRDNDSDKELGKVVVFRNLRAVMIRAEQFMLKQEVDGGIRFIPKDGMLE